MKRFPAPVLAALGAAALFGASTPAAKSLLGTVSPVLLAGLLYLGSGVGLALARVVRDRGLAPTGLARGDFRWLAGAIVAGGVIGPVLLMLGLARISAADASLLLNLEAVLTAMIAWLVLREPTDRRVVAGMALIVAGGVVLAWPGARASGVDVVGVAAIALACVAWAIDNNLTRRVAGADALFIAGIKGLVAGATNLAIALALGALLPGPGTIALAMGVGLLGYGLSLALFVIALRGLGTARTGAYFSTAPFIGAGIAIAVLDAPSDAAFWIAGALMALGVALHLSERHAHRHAHPALEHVHAHVHDDHHRHAHDFAWDGVEPHIHAHRHAPLEHVHAHYPDLHHRHPHRDG